MNYINAQIVQMKVFNKNNMKKIGLIGLISVLVGCGDTSNTGVKSAFSNLDTVKSVKKKNDSEKKDGTTFSPFSKIK